MRESYDENFFRQEVLGEYLNRQAGQVYYAFDRRENVDEVEIDPAEPLLWSWDFNINPMASVICQERDGQVTVVDEIVLGTSSTPEVCGRVLGSIRDTPGRSDDLRGRERGADSHRERIVGL